MLLTCMPYPIQSTPSVPKGDHVILLFLSPIHTDSMDETTQQTGLPSGQSHTRSEYQKETHTMLRFISIGLGWCSSVNEQAVHRYYDIAFPGKFSRGCTSFNGVMCIKIKNMQNYFQS